jgi:hypothetical protein
MNSDSSSYSPDQIKDLIIMTRLSLYNHGLYCGPEFIRQQLRCQGIKPLPSLTLIRRILKQYGLTHQRTGLYGG